MVVSGPVVISPEDLVNGSGTLRRAMELWSCRHGPVRYNQWQSAFFAMMRMPGVEDDEAAPGESLSERQKRMVEMHEEVQSGNFGPDHRAMALVAAAEDGAGGRPEEGVVAQIGSRSLQAYDQGLQVAGQGPGCATPGDLLGLPATFAMNTPRGNTVVEAGSPDRLLLAPGVEEVWDDERATHAEATVDEEERLGRLATRLCGFEGATEANVEFVIRCDQTLPE